MRLKQPAMPARRSTRSRRPPKQVSQKELRLADQLHACQKELQTQNKTLTRAKADLEHSRARYFELFDFATVAYFTFNGRGTIESVNLAGMELLQVAREQVLGSPAAPFFDDNSRLAFRQHLDRVLAT